MSLTRLHHELRLRQVLLVSSRVRLRHSLHAAQGRMRRRMTSPPMLLASAAAGWLYGWRRPHSPASRPGRSAMLGLCTSLDRLTRMLAGNPLMLLLVRQLYLRVRAGSTRG